MLSWHYNGISVICGTAFVEKWIFLLITLLGKISGNSSSWKSKLQDQHWLFLPRHFPCHFHVFCPHFFLSSWWFVSPFPLLLCCLQDYAECKRENLAITSFHCRDSLSMEIRTSVPGLGALRAGLFRSQQVFKILTSFLSPPSPSPDGRPCCTPCSFRPSLTKHKE